MAKRRAILMAALVVLGAAALPARGQSTQPRPATQPAAPVASGDVPTLGQILLDPAPGNNPRREQAAARLLAEQSDAALELIARALRPGAPAPAQLAAAAAAASRSGPRDPRLVEPLLALLASDATLAAKREAGRALGGYGSDPAVLGRLSELAVTGGAETTRQGAVAGLARIPAKPSIQALMLLLDGDAPESVERDAAEALQVVTGQPIAGDDLSGWQRWWEGVAELPDAEFAAILLQSRVAEFQANAARAVRATAALLDVSRRRYAAAGPNAQAVLLEMLQSPVPEMREVGVMLVIDEANYAQGVSPGVMELVRSAISDPEAGVRALAAQVARLRADVASLEPLMQQGARETSQPALLWQLRALTALKDPRAMPLMLTHLQTPSASVRAAAARGAAELANVTGGPAVTQAAEAIRRAFEATSPRTVSGRRHRSDLLTALAELRDPGLSDFYYRLLKSGDRAVRAPALRGIATIGDVGLSDTVVEFLSDDSARVREEAVRALGKTSRGFEHAETLRNVMQNPAETETVRNVAWQTLLAVMDRASSQQLARWPDRFRSEPQRQLAVLEILARKAEESGQSEQLASWRHARADVLMDPLNRPQDAAPLYRQALQHSLDNRGTAGTIRTRTQNVLKAYVRARDWEQVIAFSAEARRRDPSLVESIATTVKREAQAFADAGQVDAARALLETALRMEPRLDEFLERQLREQLNALPRTTG